NEDQYRTLSLAIANAFLMLMVISIISVVSNGYWYVYLVISLIGWIISIRKYFQYTKQQAASVRWYGLWPKNDEEEF
ncbi:MAG: tetrahydromethanopterin S-methyltransferase subunit C, partial [Methanosphaera sp.]|nr:tetrahydromethanopterin S-methyltransferase subunit C [Methanosphaera sp.]